MNDTTISTERLKELEGIEELYNSLHLDYVTEKAENKVLRENITTLKAKVELLHNYGKH